MEKWYSDLEKYINDNRDNIVSELMSLVRYPSISRAGEDNLPFGIEVDKALVASAKLFSDNDIPMEVKHDSGYALAVIDGEGDGIGLFGHADVVPVNDDWVKTSPFEPIEENGVLYGRGIGDNKAGVISSLYALKALRAAGVELKSRITVYVGGSEETGMQDMDRFVKNERMPEINITPDSDFPVSVGEKGILKVNVTSKKQLCDVTKFEGGQAYNVVLDRVNVALKNGESFTEEGLTSHAAHPEGSVNAARKAAEKLVTMPICDGDKEIFSAFQTALSSHYGEALDIFSTGVFGNITCANGIVKIVDGKLFFTLDIRYGNEVDSKKAIKNLSAALDKLGFDASVVEDSEGFLLDESGKPMEIILNACREVCNRPEAKPYKTYGGTYARKLRNAYAIAHSAPWNRKALGLPAGHGGAHQSDECLNVNALLDGIKYLALMVARLDEYLTK